MHAIPRLVATATAIAVALAASPAEGARLRLLDEKVVRTENGVEIDVAGSADLVPGKVTPTSFAIEPSVDLDVSVPADEMDALEVTHIHTWFVSFIIEPDAGEQVGDPVLLSYVYQSAAEATATGAAEAAAGFGRMSAFSHTPLELTFGAPVHLVREHGVTETLASFGPVVREDGAAAFADTASGQALVAIGDTIEAAAATVGIANIPPGEAATAAAAVTLEVSLETTGEVVLAIPTLSTAALLLLVVLLAAGALTVLRRRPSTVGGA